MTWARRRPSSCSQHIRPRERPPPDESDGYHRVHSATRERRVPQHVSIRVISTVSWHDIIIPTYLFVFYCLLPHWLSFLPVAFTLIDCCRGLRENYSKIDNNICTYSYDLWIENCSLSSRSKHESQFLSNIRFWFHNIYNVSSLWLKLIISIYILIFNLAIK